MTAHRHTATRTTLRSTTPVWVSIVLVAVTAVAALIAWFFIMSSG